MKCLYWDFKFLWFATKIRRGFIFDSLRALTVIFSKKKQHSSKTCESKLLSHIVNLYHCFLNQQGWNYAHSHEGSTVANTKHHNLYKQSISFLNQIIIYINKNIKLPKMFDCQVLLPIVSQGFVKFSIFLLANIVGVTGPDGFGLV